MVSSFSNFSFFGSVSVLLLLSCSGVHSRAVDDGRLGGGGPYPDVVGPGAYYYYKATQLVTVKDRHDPQYRGVC